MNKLIKYVLVTSMSVCLFNGTSSVLAQEPPQDGNQQRRNFDPAQMRERMMERYRTQLEITDDAEWKVLKEKIEKVSTLQMQSRMGGMGGMMGMRGGPGGPGGQGGADANNNPQRARRGGFGEPSAEQEALQKAIEAKASKEELAAAMTKLRAARKAKEAEVEKAQEELKQLLSTRQEAQAVLMGLLK